MARTSPRAPRSSYRSRRGRTPLDPELDAEVLDLEDRLGESLVQRRDLGVDSRRVVIGGFPSAKLEVMAFQEVLIGPCWAASSLS